MAAVSPITINTSSPPRYRSPSITPPKNLCLHANNQSSSSPQLPSPSTFISLPAPGRKKGLNAQRTPKGAKVGFASVGSLWREKRFEIEQYGHADGSKRKSLANERPSEQPPNNKEDQFADHRSLKVRPQEPDGSGAKVVPAAERLELIAPIELNSMGEPPKPVAGKRLEDEAAVKAIGVVAQDSVQRPPAHTTTNVLDGAEFATKTADPKATARAPRKPRKRKSDSIEDGEQPLQKKPRKRKVKSVLIIINSDDLDPLVTAPVELSKPKKVVRSAKVKSSSKNTKLARPEKDRAGGSDQQNDDADTGNKISKKSDLRSEEHKAMDETSAYFAPAAVVAGPTTSPEAGSLGEPLATTASRVERFEDPREEQVMAAALRRRRDWTPVPDAQGTVATNASPHDADPESLDECFGPRVSFMNAISHLSYTDTERKQCAAMGGQETIANTEPPSSPDIPLAARNELFKRPEKPLKRPKKPKKKAQTITAMATTAFKPPVESTLGLGNILPFLAPAGDDQVPIDAPELPKKEPAKVKKPRKSRKKADGSSKKMATKSDGKAAAKKPARKTKKAMRKLINVRPEYPQQQLYSPSQATARIQQQDLLFGTSSQLAPAESPEFVRNLQRAIRASEKPQHEDSVVQAASQMDPPSSQLLSPHAESYARVPTAPHGTSLSIGQAHRQLWSISSRDSHGGMLHPENPQAPPMNVDYELPEIVSRDAATTELHQNLNLENSKPLVESSTLQATSVRNGLDQAALPMSLKLPLATNNIESDVNVGAAQLREPLATETDGDARVSPLLNVEPDSHSGCIPSHPYNDDASLSSTQRPLDLLYEKLSSIGTPCSKPLKQTTATAQSPHRFRPALQPLDSNTNLRVPVLHRAESAKDYVRTSTIDKDDGKGASKRPRGRPRKDMAGHVESAASPRKLKAMGLPAAVPSFQIRPKDQRTSLGTPPGSPRSSNESWPDIDDIYDSDAPIPSPPRRRAASSPPNLQPLTLSPSSSQDADLVVSIPPRVTAIKPDMPQWPAMKALLYPRITGVVKSAPHTRDVAKLSWWEHILLYDPIVVEDLTKWLNEQGLFVEIVRNKKKKAKQKKDDLAMVHDEDAMELETQEVPLQPWMVQRWCEEHSICCYMKDVGWRSKRSA